MTRLSVGSKDRTVPEMRAIDMSKPDRRAPYDRLPASVALWLVARLMAVTPSTIHHVLTEHKPTGDGGCASCTTSGSWPCDVMVAAFIAQVIVNHTQEDEG